MSVGRAASARDPDALALATGELIRELVGVRRQAEVDKQRPCRVRIAPPPEGQGEVDVLGRGQEGEEVGGLEHDAERVAAITGPRGIVKRAKRRGCG